MAFEEEWGARRLLQFVTSLSIAYKMIEMEADLANNVNPKVIKLMRSVSLGFTSVKSRCR